MPRPSKPPPDRRPVLFGALVVACALAATTYAVFRPVFVPSAPPRAADTPAEPAVLNAVLARPHVVFLHSPGGDSYRQVAVVPLDAIDGERYLAPLMCQRVAMVSSGGLCMGAAQTASTFDAHFMAGPSVPQPGTPTRTRVAANGQLGTMTWFVAGHSYADAGFSTQTVLVDPRTGQTVADLEQFTIIKDDQPFRAVDFNFWGVTLASDANRFYVTLASGGRTYLLQGDVAQRTARVLRENVECPSLSPDGTRLAFKKRTDPESPREWRLAILNLQTMAESMLRGENHSVDDQVEWLDDNHILYALPDEGPPATIAQDIWVATVDGTAPPKKLLKGALSPTVVR